MTASIYGMSASSAPPARLPVVLISLTLMAELFDTVAPQTVYRWNTSVAGRDPILPPPIIKVGSVPVWTEDVVHELAAARKLPINRKVLQRIRTEQHHHENMVKLVAANH